MNDEHKGGLREHEKFWAFIVLLVMVGGLVLLASTFNPTAATDIVAQGKLRIIDAAITGLLTITGMAAQALFRVSSTDRLQAETALEAARKLPAQPSVEPQPVLVTNPPEDPANVTDAHAGEIVDDRPAYAR